MLVDNWYEREVLPHQPHRPSVKAHLSDSEVMTLALLMDYLPFPGETQFLGFIRANYLEWFPHLLDQSQFNRRLRQLADVLLWLQTGSALHDSRSHYRL